MRCASLSVLSAVLAIGTDAQAGRPLVTEDAAVLAVGECALETYVGSFGADAVPTAHLLSSQIGCGLISQTQLSVTAVRAVLGEGHVDTLGLAGKTSLASVGDTVAWSLAYGAIVRRASRTAVQMDQLYATLAGSIQLTDSLVTHLNVGWTEASHPHCQTRRWAVAIDGALTDDLHLVAEAFADGIDRRPWVQGGVSASVNKQLSFNASYGRHARDHGARALTLGVTVGF